MHNILLLAIQVSTLYDSFTASRIAKSTSTILVAVTTATIGG